MFKYIWNYLFFFFIVFFVGIGYKLKFFLVLENCYIVSFKFR